MCCTFSCLTQFNTENFLGPLVTADHVKPKSLQALYPFKSLGYVDTAQSIVRNPEDNIASLDRIVGKPCHVIYAVERMTMTPLPHLYP